ncbi:MAG: PAS domain-containing protein, partial [Cytophagaceae bacterium]
MNEAFKRIASPREYAKKKWADVYQDSPDPRSIEALKNVYLKGGKHEDKEVCIRVAGADGNVEERYCNFFYDRIDGLDERDHGVLIQVIDVTEEYHARLAAKEREREAIEAKGRLAATLTSMPIGVAILEGPDHVYSFTNEVHNQFFGGRLDFLGSSFRKALPELVGSEIPGLLDRVFETGKAFYADEFLISVPQMDGTKRNIIYRLAFQPLTDIEGHVNGVVVTVIDLTESVQNRQKLQANNELLEETQRRLSTATKVAKVGFFDWDIAGNLIYFSDQMQADWGIAAGVPLEDVLAQIIPEHRGEIQKKIQAAIASGEAYHAVYQIQLPSSG